MKEDSNFPKMHISLYVSDLTSTVNFYTAFFGQPANKVKPGYAKYILDKPSLVISFVQNPDRVQQNFGHLGFQVASGEEMYQRLEKAKLQNIVSREEIGTACCYAVQDKFWVIDPDGVQWEVYYFHEDAEFNDPHYSLEDSSACCIPDQPTEKGAKPKIRLAEIQQCTPDSGCC